MPVFDVTINPDTGDFDRVLSKAGYLDGIYLWLSGGNANQNIDIGAYNFTTSAFGVFGEIIDNGLTVDSGIYTNGFSQLVSAIPTSGDLGYWNRTGTTISPATTNDIIATTPAIEAKDVYAIRSIPVISSPVGGLGGSAGAIVGNPSVTGTEYVAGDSVDALFFSPTVPAGVTAGSGGLDINAINVTGALALFVTSFTAGTIRGLKVVPLSSFRSAVTVNEVVGVDVQDCSFIQGTNNIGVQIQQRLSLPLCGASNYQQVLLGTGTGSGTWFGGTSGVRAFASSTTQLEIDEDLEVVGNGASYGARSNIRYSLMGA